MKRIFYLNQFMIVIRLFIFTDRISYFKICFSSRFLNLFFFKNNEKFEYFFLLKMNSITMFHFLLSKFIENAFLFYFFTIIFLNIKINN